MGRGGRSRRRVQGKEGRKVATDPWKDFFLLLRKLNRPSFKDRGSKADTSVFTTL